jgi:hypothetical protein
MSAPDTSPPLKAFLALPKASPHILKDILGSFCLC